MALKQFAVFVGLLAYIVTSKGYLLDDNPYRHFVTLDKNGKFNLEWQVDMDAKRVTFNVLVNTTGYVGFGLSRKAKMDGADIVIGGVAKDGKPYFTDRHAVGTQLPEIDDSQDWKLHSAWEKNSQTFLSFSRAFDTCDEDHDLPITEDALSIIWAYGEAGDKIEYHYQHRGSYDIHLLDPDLTPREFEDVKKGVRPTNTSVFGISTTVKLMSQETMYWCTFHRIPTSTKQHIVGFNTVFPTEEDRKYVKQLILHRCQAPPGVRAPEFFEGPTRSGGSECYFLDFPNPLPTSYCREAIHVWGSGGRSIFFPENAGLESSPGEYYMLQAHYDNPLSGTEKVSVSLEIYHTSNIREKEVGLFQVGTVLPGSVVLIVPPSSPSHSIYGHCASSCTQKMIPPEGVNVFAVMLHSHISGKGLRAMHFRNKTELKYIQVDENFKPSYQPFRILHTERKILPGDQLILRCNYDTTERNGTVVYGGFSQREGACSFYMYYYSRKAGFSQCRSLIREKEYWDFLGLSNVTWSQSKRQMVITYPLDARGLTIQDYVNQRLTWTSQKRETLQRMHINLAQISECPRLYFETPSKQLQFQLDTQVLEKTGRLPGSDGRAYETVDEDFAFTSVLPRSILRYSRPPQCSKRATLRKQS